MNNKKLKVLFVLNAYAKPSGAEHVLIDFLKSAKEIMPAFLMIGPDKNAITRFIEMGQDVFTSEYVNFVPTKIPLMHVVSRQWLMELFGYIMCLSLQANHIVRQLRQDKSIQVVYFNNSFEAAVFYPLFKNKHTVVHIHDMVNMFRPAHKRCVLKACNQAKNVLTASKACKWQLIENGIHSDKIKVAYNGMTVPIKHFRVDSIQVLNIGFVGSVIHRKGFDLYVDILNRLYSSFEGTRSVKATVITNSNLQDKYFCQNLAHLNPHIEREIYCNLSRDAVFNKYEEMYLLLVPSRFDPLPTVVMEAILNGVPVFGSKKDGIPEMIADERMMFPCENVLKAVENIQKWLLLSREEQDRIMREAQTYISDRFTDTAKKETVLSMMYDAIS